MNHRIFERTLRFRVTLGACLFECLLSHNHTLDGLGLKPPRTHTFHSCGSESQGSHHRTLVSLNEGKRELFQLEHGPRDLRPRLD